MGKVLFVSGSVGLGHVGRDIAVANAIRKLKPGIEIDWMAGDPARVALRARGERVLPESEDYDQHTGDAEAFSKEYRLNILEVASSLTANFEYDGKKIWDVVTKYDHDLVIWDEAYEVGMYPGKHKVKPIPIAGLIDYFGTPGELHGLKWKFMRWMWNHSWMKSTKIAYDAPSEYLFFGELEDVEDKRMGLLLPNGREHVANSHIKFVGYPLSFDLKEVSDRKKLKKELGYDDAKVVLCTIGGTSVGKPLLDLCLKSYPLMKAFEPDLRMILAVGPHVDMTSFKAPDGVTVLGYAPELYKHMAVCDLAICSGGGTTTLELTALQRPFLYFPLIHHFEQENVVAVRCERQKAGIRMAFDKTTPESLAHVVEENIGKKVDYRGIRFDGVDKAAGIIVDLL